MAVDLSTLALELNTAGLARGEKEASAILDRLAGRLDAFIEKAQQMEGAISRALSVKGTGSNLGRAAKEADAFAGSLDAMARAQQKAADESLRQQQALARLLQAQGKSADAVKVLEKALDGFTGSQIQATRAQIQLTNLQNDYANSPLIGAVRAQTTALAQFGAANSNVEKILKGTADANQRVGDSLSDSTEATLAQAQALAQIQTLSGDAAGAANTLAAGLKSVAEQQSQAVAETERFTTKVASALQAGAAVLNIVSAGFNFFAAVQKEATGDLTETEAAAKVITKAYRGIKSGADAVRASLSTTIPVAQELASKVQTAADMEFDQIGQKVKALDAELKKRRELAAAAIQSNVQRPTATVSDPNFGPGLLRAIALANEKMIKAGQEAARSFASGLRGGTEAVEKAGKDIGEATEEGIRKNLQQRSPSRVLLALGREAALSFASGFAQGKKRIDAITTRDLVKDGATTQRLSIGGSQLQSLFNSLKEGDGRLAKTLQRFDGLREKGTAAFAELTGNARGTSIALGTIGASIGVVTVGFLALAAAIAASIPALISIGEAGIRANSQFEQTRIGIASVVSSVATLRNSQGVKLEGVDALNAALPIARKQLEALRVDALQTALEFKDIAPAFLQAVGPGLAAGLNLDQVRKTVVDVSQLIVPLTGDASQLGQELRSILTGDIGPDSGVAKALGITKQAIDAAKEQGRLAEFLNEKLKAANATGRLMANTFEAAASNLKEAGTVLAATVTEGLFDSLRTQINATLPQIFETAGGKVNIAPAFRGITDGLADIFNQVGGVFTQALDGAFTAIKGISGFLAENREQLNGMVSAGVDFAQSLGAAGVDAGKLVGVVIQLSGAFKLATLQLEIAGGVLDAIHTVLGPILKIAGAISDGLGKLGSILGIVREDADATKTALEQAGKIKISDVEGRGGQVKGLQEQITAATALTGQQARLNEEQDKFKAILSTLTPQQQALVNAYGTQEERVNALRAALGGQLEALQALSRAQQAQVVAGITAQQQQIDAQQKKNAELDKEIILRDKLLQKGEQTRVEFNPTGPESKPVIEDIAQAQAKLTEARNAGTKALDELNAKQSEGVNKLRALLPALNQTEAALLADVKAGQLSASSYNSLKAALDATKASAADATLVVNQQADAVDQLTASLDRLNQAANTEVDKGVKAIALKARDEAEAKALTRDALKNNDDFFVAVQNKNRVAANLRAATETIEPPQRKTGGGGGSRRVESAARQDRAAEESLEQARAKARFDIQEKLTKNIIELDKAAFEQRLISADDYFNRILRRELELQDIEKKRIQGEAAASARRLLATKDGSPEEIRELTQLVDLQARLRVIELDRPNIQRRINGELETTKKLEAERNREAIAQAALGGPGVRANARIIADTEARGQLKLDQPQRELRREEQQLQAAANAGFIREEQLSDAVTLARRRYRDAILESLEAKKRIALADNENAGRFAEAERINEEIDSIQLLGTELTRAERLRKRFADQGVLDYSRVNEGVENLLAEQKGLTEIFQDFRAGQVQTAFGLIETGVDKLTEKLGVLGDAVGDFLKSLLKLAATSIFKKLFGLDSGAGSQPGFALAGGAPAAAGGGGLLGGLIPGLSGGGGGQQPGGGILGSLFGGGGGNFLTGGFAGGNPAQAAIGGGQGGGGILGNLLGGGQQGGGFNLGSIFGGGGGQSSPVGGLLGKIPGIGGLFGGGAGAGPAPILGQGGFGAGGAGLGGGAGAFSGLAGLGAGGLLAGGGILGSFLGGSSKTGKLLGGIGGTLGAGALGASGIFGGGLAAALPALFSNPFTAIIGAGLLGTALAFRLFGNQDFKKFQKAVDSTYAVKIKGDKEGKSVFEQAKGIGEQAFGKGSFKNKIKETIALKDVKDIIAAYGEATGQENSPLVKRATQVREIAEVGNSSNNFVRRATGGLVPMPYFKGGFLGLPDAGRDSVLTALRGQEYVTRPEVTRRQGRGRFDALNSGNAAILSFDQRGAGDLIRLLESGKIPLFSRGMRERLAAQIGGSDGPRAEIFTRANGGYVGPTLPSFDSGGYVPSVAPQAAPARGSSDTTGLRVVVAQLAEMIGEFGARLNTIKPDDILRLASPSTVADAASQGFAQSTTATQNAQRALGVQQ